MSFAGLFLNFVAIPLMTIIQVGGLMVAGMPAWADPISQSAAMTVRLSASALLQSAAIVDSAPWLARDVPPPVWWLAFAYYTSALALLSPLARRVALPAYVVCSRWSRVVARDAVPPPSMPVRVVVLDVGQGE